MLEQDKEQTLRMVDDHTEQNRNYASTISIIFTEIIMQYYKTNMD